MDVEHSVLPMHFLAVIISNLQRRSTQDDEYALSKRFPKAPRNCWTLLSFAPYSMYRETSMATSLVEILDGKIDH